MNVQTEKGLKIYQTAADCLGKVMSGSNAAFGCAISLNNVVEKAVGHPVGGVASTHSMFNILDNSPLYKEIDLKKALPGDIIISPTGYGNGTLPNGHCGVVAKYGILSNNSENGLWQEKWKLENWIKYYGKLGGYPVKFFRIL